MGRKDKALCQYLRKPEVFADFCNGIIYGGKRVILVRELAESQEDFSRRKRGRDGVLRAPLRERDVSKLLCREAFLLKISIENQDKINYCMPVRCMEYDEMEITKQLRRLQQRNKADKTLKPGAEFLSGIRETDRLIPVATIVFYHGDGKWTAATQLQDMLEMRGVDGPLRKLITNYRMNIVCLEDLQEEHFETGLREMIALMKRRKDKEAFYQYCFVNEERFSRLDVDTYDLLCAMLNMKLPVQNKEKYRNQNREDYNMCVAIRELMRDEKRKGIEIGKKWGEKRGEKRGEERLGILIERLMNDGRQAEILSASRNVALRRKLYLEYDI